MLQCTDTCQTRAVTVTCEMSLGILPLSTIIVATLGSFVCKQMAKIKLDDADVFCFYLIRQNFCDHMQQPYWIIVIVQESRSYTFAKFRNTKARLAMTFAQLMPYFHDYIFVPRKVQLRHYLLKIYSEIGHFKSESTMMNFLLPEPRSERMTIFQGAVCISTTRCCRPLENIGHMGTCVPNSVC